MSNPRLAVQWRKIFWLLKVSLTLNQRNSYSSLVLKNICFASYDHHDFSIIFFLLFTKGVSVWETTFHTNKEKEKWINFGLEAKRLEEENGKVSQYCQTKPVPGDMSSLWHTDFTRFSSMGDLWAELNQEMMGSKLQIHDNTTVTLSTMSFNWPCALCFSSLN